MERIYALLRMTALKDGRISEDEAKMLDSIIGELDNYSLILENALKDGIISEQERFDLATWRKRVWDRAVDVAMEDNQLNQDENELLLTLIKILRLLEEKDYSEEYL